MADFAPLIVDGNRKREFDQDSDDLLVKIDNLSDVDTATVVPVDGDLLRFNVGAGNWEPYSPFDVVEFEPNGLINQTTTFEDFMNVNFLLPSIGNYLIHTSFTWSFNDNGQDFRSQLLVDSVQQWEHRQEPKDAGGTGVVLPVIGGGTANTGTNQRHISSELAYLENQAAGNINVQLQFAGSQNNDEAAIYRATINVRRVD